MGPKASVTAGTSPSARGTGSPKTLGVSESPRTVDVFAILTAQEHDGPDSRHTSQRTKLALDRLRPVWDEDFEFPVVTTEGASGSTRDISIDRLHQALGLSASNGSPTIEIVDGLDLATHLWQPAAQDVTMDADKPDHSVIDAMNGTGSVDPLSKIRGLAQMAFVMYLQAGWVDGQPSEDGTEADAEPEPQK